MAVNPRSGHDAKSLAKALAKALRITVAGVLATIRATPKGQAAPIITLRRPPT